MAVGGHGFEFAGEKGVDFFCFVGGFDNDEDGGHGVGIGGVGQRMEGFVLCKTCTNELSD